MYFLLSEMPTETEIMFELDLGEPPQELLRWAKDSIREDPDSKYQILEEFKDMIYARGECSPQRMDDAFLLRFLRGRKFTLESAYQLFVNYNNFKETHPNFVDGVDFEHLERAGQCDLISVPPYREQTGKRIMLYKLGKWKPDLLPVEDVLKATLLILELAILEPRAQILGGILFIDCRDVTIEQVLWMTPSIAHTVFQLSVTSFPLKLEAVHIVSESWICGMFYNMFKPFINERMKKRLFFHGDNMESLHKHIDPKYLPETYGGFQPEYSYAPWLDGFKKNDALLKELQLIGYQL